MNINYGWLYPPGVTGNEPEIAGYGDELWIENADDVVWHAVKNKYLREGMTNRQAVINSYIFFQVWDMTDKEGPVEEEIMFMSYLDTRRRGYDDIESMDRASFITDSVLYHWADLKDLWNKRYNSFEDTGPDPDQLYDDMRDREYDRED